MLKRFHIHSCLISVLLEFNYETTLDASSSTMPRMFFLHKERENSEELVTVLSKGQTWCKERQAYLIVSQKFRRLFLGLIFFF